MRRRGFVLGLALLGCSSSSSAPVSTSAPSPLDAVRAVRPNVGRSSAWTLEAGVARASGGGLRVEVARDRARVSLRTDDALPAATLVVESPDHAAPAISGSSAVFGGVQPFVVDAGPDRVEDLHVVSSGPTTIRERIVPGGGVAELRLRERRVEAVDARGVVRIGSAPIVAWDAHGAAFEPSLRLDREGDAYVLSIDVQGPAVVDPAWSTTPSLAHPRFDHSMHRLPSGKILVLGGNSAFNSSGTFTPESTAELYDPAKNTWTSVGSFRNPLQSGYVVLDLPGGDVLVVGGRTASGPVNAVERFRAADERFATASEIASMSTARSDAGAAVVAGKVLVFGGSGPSGPLATTEIYDPAANTWSAAPPMSKARAGAAWTTLQPSGDVLVVMGTTGYDGGELFDAATSTWSSSTSTMAVRGYATVAAVPGDHAVLYGGLIGYNTISEVMLFDRATKGWVSAGKPPAGHGGAPNVLLPDGELLIVGGSSGESGSSGYADLFDVTKFAAGKAWTYSILPQPRRGHSLTPLDGGKSVFLAGGSSIGSVSTWAPMRFSTATRTWKDLSAAGTRTSRARHAAIELADGRVFFTGGTSDGTTALGLSEIYGNALGTTCTDALECPSGNCVDGVCCDAPCLDPCGACNLGGKEGHCSPVTGVPTGGRACPGDIPADVCAVPACDGKTMTTCAGFASDASTVCVPGRCEGATLVGASHCDGAGKCVRQSETSCAPFACRAGACVDKCTSASDCSGGSTCDAATGKCVSNARCTDDKLGYFDAAGEVRSCGAFRCGTGGTCLTVCATSDDCAPGYLCNAPACVQPTGEDGGGGCAVGRPAHGLGAAMLLLGALGLASRRRAHAEGSR